MDPATAMQVASAAFSIAETAFAAGKKLHTFVNKVKQIEETALEFERETNALGTACYLVGTSVKKVLLEQTAQSEKASQSQMLFTCLEQQLEDCRRSIDQLEAAIACAEVEKVNGSGCFMRAVLQIKLNCKAGDVEAARNLIRSHTSSLQITLLSIAINVSYVIPKRVDANLRQQLDEIAHKREELEKLRSQRTLEEDILQNRNEDAILAVSDKVISSGRTLCGDSLDGRSTKRESIFGKANFISGWIQNANAIDSLASPTFTEETETTSIFSAGQQKPPSSYTEDGASTGRAGQGSMTNPGDGNARDDLDDLDSDDDFAIEAAEHAIKDGRAAFERQDYEEASESLQEALKMVRELPTNRQTTYDSFDIRYMLGVCAFHVDPPPVAKEALISIVENTPRTKAHGDRTSLQLQAGHFLAQTYIKLGELEQARSTCTSTLRGRRRVFGKEHESVFESLALMATIEQLQGDASRAKVYSSMLPNDSRKTLLGSFDHLTHSTRGMTSLGIATRPSRIVEKRAVTEPDVSIKYAAGVGQSSPGSEASSSIAITQKDVISGIEDYQEAVPARSEPQLSKQTQDVYSSRKLHQARDDSNMSHQPKTPHLRSRTLPVDAEGQQGWKTSTGEMPRHVVQQSVNEKARSPSRITTQSTKARLPWAWDGGGVNDFRFLSSTSTLSSLDDIFEKKKRSLDLGSPSSSLMESRRPDFASPRIDPTLNAGEVGGYRNKALRDLALSSQYIAPSPADRPARKRWLHMLVGQEESVEANPVQVYKEGNMSSMFFDEPRINMIDALDSFPKALVLQRDPDEIVRKYVKKGLASKVFASLVPKQLYIWTSPLHLAALFGDLKVVQALLKAGAKVQKTCHSRTTALHCAAMGGHYDVARVLIEAGCPINVESPRYGTPLALAVIGERLDVIDLLVQRDANLRGHLQSFGTIAHVACMTGDLGLVKALYRDHELLTVPSEVVPGWYRECQLLMKGHGSNVQAEEPSTARIDRSWEVIILKVEHCLQITPLAIAAYMGHASIVEYLLSLNCDANVRCSLHYDTNEAFSVLEIACLTGHDSVIGVLLQHGLSPTKHAEDVLDPLYRPKDELWAAIVNGHNTCVASLLHHGAQMCVAHLLFVMNENKSGITRILVENGLTPRMAATALKYVLAIDAPCGPDANRVLIRDVEGVATYTWTDYRKIKGSDSDGTLLHFVKSDRSWAIQLVQDLIDAKADIDAPNSKGESPLMIAARNGNKGVIKKLLSNRASTRLRSDDGRRAVDYARESGKRDVLELCRSSV